MKNKQLGVEALEMALVLPLLLLIVFAIIDFSLVFYDKAVITNASREGARWASIQSSSTYGNTFSSTGVNATDPCGVANSYAKNYLVTLGGASVTPYSSWTPSSRTYSTGELESITTTYTYTGIGFGLGTMLSSIGLLAATSSMYHE